MVENIRVIVSSLNSLIVMTLKCLRNLGVMGLRPPPGGPMAASNCMSTNESLLVSFLSYLKEKHLLLSPVLEKISF